MERTDQQPLWRLYARALRDSPIIVYGRYEAPIWRSRIPLPLLWAILWSVDRGEGCAGQLLILT